jgi:hypothetical protein
VPVLLRRAAQNRYSQLKLTNIILIGMLTNTCVEFAACPVTFVHSIMTPDKPTTVIQ